MPLRNTGKIRDFLKTKYPCKKKDSEPICPVQHTLLDYHPHTPHLGVLHGFGRGAEPNQQLFPNRKVPVLPSCACCSPSATTVLSRSSVSHLKLLQQQKTTQYGKRMYLDLTESSISPLKLQTLGHANKWGNLCRGKRGAGTDLVPAEMNCSTSSWCQHETNP